MKLHIDQRGASQHRDPDRHRRHAVPGRLGDRRHHRRRARPRPAGPPAGRGAPGGARRALLEVRPARRARRRRPGRAASRAGCASRSAGCATRPSLAALRNELQRVLTDVREAVEDWPRMRTQALDPGRRAGRRAALPVPDKDITDSVALLRWLADDHFTFLGYREYRLVDAPTASGRSRRCWAPAWASCARTRRGARRAVLDEPRGVRAGDGEAAAHHHQGQLALHRAPSGLPGLHRVQDLRRDGNVVGERRFLGLFSLGRLPHLGPRPAGHQAQGGRGGRPLRPEPARATPART